MRILHIYKDYAPVVGGIENHVRVLAEGSARRGHRVTVLVTSLDRHTHVDEANGVTIVKSGRWMTVSSAPLSPAMFRWARRLGRDMDVVHLHFPYPPGELAHHLAGSPTPTVITYHSDIVRQKVLLAFYRPFLRRVLARADRILTTSPVVRNSSAHLRAFREKCRVIPVGTRIERFAAGDPAAVSALRARVMRAGTEHLLLSVGKLRYYKGLGTLIAAMPMLPAAHLVIVGTGPMERTWREEATGRGLNERVTFMGNVADEDLPAYYRAADLFVLPANARAEAYGTVLVEAMAAGLPCVTTEVGSGTSWVVQDGRTGRVVPPRDPLALSRAIASLLDNEEERRRMGAAGRDRARREFDEELMIDRVLAEYRTVLPDGKTLAGSRSLP